MVNDRGQRSLGPWATFLSTALLAVCLTSVAEAQRPTGDLDGDCRVDLQDLAILGLRWSDASCGPQCGDLTGDSSVDPADLCILANYWLERGQPILITEFLGSNQSAIPPDPGQQLDEDGDASDWIELHNCSTIPVGLSGWSLTDDPNDLTRWTFPEGAAIEPGGYLVVFASGKDRTDPAGQLHTRFKLSADGEFLALVQPDGVTIAHQYAAVEYEPGRLGYPPQRSNRSYGLLDTDPTAERYFAAPTPGGPNRDPRFGTLSDIRFSIGRGFYDAPLDVQITTTADDVVIRYTTDGSDPTLENGRTYTGPIRVESTAVLRAAAFKDGWLPTNIGTQTYILHADAAMRSLPVVSLAGDERTVFYAPEGICAIQGGEYTGGFVSWRPVDPGDYNNPMGHGIAYERPVSVEMIHANGDAFQADCGIRVSGSVYSRSRYRPSSKFSFRLYFRDEYGLDWLDYPFLPSAPVDRLQHIVLRAGQSDQVNPFIKDELARRLQRDMSGAACNGAFVNLFINARHAGYYNPCERIDEEMMQEQYDSDCDWDVVSHWRPEDDNYDWQPGDPIGRPYRFDARDGDMTAMNDLLDYALAHDLSIPSHYEQVARRLDVPWFIDYLILEGYTNHRDWPHNNWAAARERSDGPLSRWRFYAWDMEHCFYNSDIDAGFKAPSSGGGVQPIGILYERLRPNPNFRQLFAQRVQTHFFHGGALTPENVIARFEQLRAVMSAVLPGMDTSIRDQWAPQRNAHVLDSLRGLGLFTFPGPQFSIDGLPVFGGPIAPGDLLALTDPTAAGTIYYTLDGSDPRGETVHIPDAPAEPTGRILWQTWTGISGPALSGLTSHPDYPDNPSDEQWIDSFQTPVRWADNYGSRVRGFLYPPITGDYTFWISSDDESQLWLGSNPTAESARGIAAVGSWVPAFDWDRYASQQSSPVRLEAGGVYYIEALQKDGTGGDHLSVAWQPPGGSREIIPGAFLGDYVHLIPEVSIDGLQYTGPIVLPGPITVIARTLSDGLWSPLVQAVFTVDVPLRINEVMADNENTWEDPDEPGEFPDWIELHNPTENAIDLTGMILTDDPNTADNTPLPALTIPAGDCLILYADGDPSQGPLHLNFKLDKDGETVYLLDPDGEPIDTLRFNALPPDDSFGRDPDRPTDTGRLLTPTPGAPNSRLTI